MQDINLKTYNEKEVVAGWSSRSELQLPEKKIFKEYFEYFNNKKMLDIGVGGGRTTLHFAPFTREYIGIDYSKEMINACKKRLEHFPSNIKFEVVNANDLSQFQNESFDFILFSFNGLDYSNEMDRKNVLKGIIRICKPNSIFCFSTHNIQTINHYYAFNFSFNLKHLLKEIYRQYFLRSMNQKKNIKKEFTFFWDGAHNFKLHTYYCNPSFQIKQLSDLGFRNIKVYDLSGNDITNSDKLAATKDAWLYYICEK